LPPPNADFNKKFKSFFAKTIDTLGKIEYIIDTVISTLTLQVLKNDKKRGEMLGG